MATRILPINPARSSPEVIDQAVAALRRGELVVVPTETVYGVAADPHAPGAIDRIYAAKGRPETKQLPLFAASVADVQAVATVWNVTAERIARTYWPGPLTLVLRTANGFTGFRVPDHAVPLLLVRKMGSMLAVTSANRSGEPEALTAAKAAEALGSAVSVVLDAGRSPGGTPSTVVKIDGDKVEVLREGAIGRAKIMETANSPV